MAEDAEFSEEYYQEGLDDTWLTSPAAGSDNFKVVIRIRPPLPRELRGTGFRPYQCTTHVEAGRLVTLSENLPALIGPSGSIITDGAAYNTYRFTFDHVYDQACTQDDIYRQSAQQVVLSILQGYNAAIIAYGQTGTGKTHTMEGEMVGPHRGIIPRTVEDIFTYIVNDPEPSSKYLVRASYLQIYNEVISDLLRPERSNLAIREDKRRGVFVDGLSEWVVRSPGEVYTLMQRGQSLRATGQTKLNEVSSRSHAVCIIIVEKCTSTSDDQTQSYASWSRPSTASGMGTQSIKVGKLNLVDLAGSERVHVTGAVGKRLEESKKINASLSALGNVISALTERKERAHIPYRDSRLTRILEDSLGGNCKTTMICTLAPAMDAFQETLSTLKFANRAKNIKNQAIVNEDADQRTLLRKYERELRRLRAELTRRNRELVDKRHLLEVEEQKKRAEADKLAALTALEQRSREFLREKEEKRKLELKMQSMQSQMLRGQEAGALSAQYERKMRALEAERRAIEEEKQKVEGTRSEVDRYKQLLLKQRDIMIALTARLNQRDEQIVGLREDLEESDRYQRTLEDQLDHKTNELIVLRRAAVVTMGGLQQQDLDAEPPSPEALMQQGGSLLPGPGGVQGMAGAERAMSTPGTAGRAGGLTAAVHARMLANALGAWGGSPQGEGTGMDAGSMQGSAQPGPSTAPPQWTALNDALGYVGRVPHLYTAGTGLPVDIQGLDSQDPTPRGSITSYSAAWAPGPLAAAAGTSGRSSAAAAGGQGPILLGLHAGALTPPLSSAGPGSPHGSSNDLTALTGRFDSVMSMNSGQHGGQPSVPAPAAQVQSLTAENMRLARRVEMLQQQLATVAEDRAGITGPMQAASSSQPPALTEAAGAGVPNSVRELQASLAVAQKERNALQQIFERKVRRTITECLAQAQQAAAELSAGATSSNPDQTGTSAGPVIAAGASSRSGAEGTSTSAAGGAPAAATLPRLVSRLKAMDEIVTKIYEALCVAPPLTEAPSQTPSSFDVGAPAPP